MYMESLLSAQKQFTEAAQFKMFGGKPDSWADQRSSPGPMLDSSGASLSNRFRYKEWRKRLVDASHHVGPRNPVRRTTMISCRRLGKRLGVSLTLAAEAFQETGSCQIRAAYKIVSSVPQSLFITWAGGDFGRALAYVCSRLRKTCIVVISENCSEEDLEAIREYGGRVELVQPGGKALSRRVREMSEKYSNAYVIDPCEDPFAIKGISSLGKEIGLLGWGFDMVVTPIAGGPLASGIILGLKEAHRRTAVIGAERVLSNNLGLFHKGGWVANRQKKPVGIIEANAAQTGLSTCSVLLRSLTGIVEVTDVQTARAMRLLFELVNLKVDPTAALSVASLLANPGLFRGCSVCCVISGGNVNRGLYEAVLSDQE